MYATCAGIFVPAGLFVELQQLFTLAYKLSGGAYGNCDHPAAMQHLGSSLARPQSTCLGSAPLLFPAFWGGATGLKLSWSRTILVAYHVELDDCPSLHRNGQKH
jgi:hypothetical protein